ncbi:YfjI family protein [Sporosarcina luteola]|uniref:YfjI family protein n=1 Tax=Sporosarcina luteola TaxID=582850 RepID=UPI00203C69C2|nr:YfjI family protein [Sporosarcina luteola]MCM3636377.1 YfjI family protein [Sporosarcina luteola]
MNYSNIIELSNQSFEKIKEWEVPIDFNNRNLPKIETEVFPYWIKNFIHGVAEESQTPPDASAMASIAVLSTVLSDKFIVSPRKGWTETLNTYTVVALGPANRKSAVFNRFTSPITEFERIEAERTKSIIAEKNVKRKLKESRLAFLEAEYSKKGEPEILEEATKISEELSEEGDLIRPRFITADATPEKLAELMQEHGERIAILSSEGAEAFEMMSGRYGKQNLDIYLKAFSADYTAIDRMLRESVVLQKPRLTIGLFVQSSVIENLPKNFSNRGLTQRFLYALPTSTLGYRSENPKEVEDHVENLYYSNVQKLLEYHMIQDGQEKKESHHNPLNSLKKLTFDKKAFEYMLHLEKEREAMLRNQDIHESFQGWIGKLTGQIIRIAALFHIADNISNGIEEVPLTIDVETLYRANILRDYFISHAEQAFGIMGADKNEEDTKYILRRILDCSKGEGSIAFRELQQLVKRKFKNTQELRNILNILEEMHYIRNELAGSKNIISINPVLLKSQR